MIYTMELPVIGRLSDFEAGINCLSSTSFLSRLISILGVEKISNAHSYWKWGALILALVAALSSLINRIKVLIVRVQKYVPLAAQPLLSKLEEADYSDEDEACSSSSSDDDDDEPRPSFDHRQKFDEDFHVAGSSSYGKDQWQNRNLRLRRRRSFVNRFSWSEFANGKSVVKLWDGLGLGLDVDSASGSVISIWDLNKDREMNSSLFDRICQIPASSISTPPVVMAAAAAAGALGGTKNLALSVWDTRIRSRAPAIYAEWRPQPADGMAVDSSGGAEKVYIRDDFSGTLTVGDIRNVSSQLGNLTECDGETWWDADAVIVPSDGVDECSDGSCDRLSRRG